METQLSGKRRSGSETGCGGSSRFDQTHYFSAATEGEVRAAVRRDCQNKRRGRRLYFCPSDHFFDADPRLISAFADEARKCRYDKGGDRA